MSRNGGGKNGSLVAGILIGMVAGLAIAGGVAYYIMKQPRPFQGREPQHEVAPEPQKPAAPAVQPVQGPATAPVPARAASAVGETKPRFEFYKVLTDKPEDPISVPKSSKPAPAPREIAKPQAAAQAPSVSNDARFLQAGSFSNADDADKLKARLALLGMEASVQTVTLPEKGVWHRVRLGPYNTAEGLSRARDTLKQNGVDATPVH
jgi:cell division protein FtsN